jgi:cobalt-zinc-cadmium resistance protein CzcA
MNLFISIILRNKMTILFFVAAITLWAAWGIKDLAIDAVPDITNVQVVVNVKTNALDPENIELQVTRVLEIELSGLPNLIDMRSISKFGLAQVTLIFEEGSDLYWARQQVSERLVGVNLPEGISAELAPITTGLGEVYMYTLTTTPGSHLNTLTEVERLTELRTIQDYVVKPHLKKVRGVADIDSNGGFVKQIHINFFPKLMDQFGVTIQQMMSKLQSIGVSAGGGYIQTSDEQVIVRTYPVMKSLETISNLSLGLSTAGKPILVKDVAQVRIDHSLRVGAATVAGNEAVLGTVLMRVGSNGRDVVEGVNLALKDLRLPVGIILKPLYTRKFLVDNTIKTVSTSLLEGAVLVILVLLVLLGSFKAALIVTLAIPLSMIIAMKGMNFFGITGNLMSLGAIDFGLLVDGSVVVIESILAKMAISGINSKSFKSKTELIQVTCKEVMPPVISGILLIMAVYLPILTLEGVEGKMFRPMALTVLMALGISLLVAVFVMPIMALMFLKGESHDQISDHDTWLFRKIKKVFIPSFDYVLKKPLPFFGGSGVMLALSLYLITHIGSDFVPELDEGDIVLGLTRSARISIDASVAEQKKAEEVLKTFPEIKEIFARLGTPESATDPMGVNLADTFLILEKDRSKWRFKQKDDLINSIMTKLRDAFPHVEVSSTQPIGMRFNEMLEGSRADISLRIYGNDLQSLYNYGEKAKEIIEPINGVESIEQDPLTALRQGPVLDINPNFVELGRYGISLEDLNRTVGLSLAGLTLGTFIQENIKYPIILHLDEKLRDKTSEIAKLPIGLPLGGTIPLDKLASIIKEEKVTTIARQWGKRYSAISINVSGRDIGGLVNEAKQKIDEKLGLLPGHELSWGGQFKNLERANKRLMIIVPLTLFSVFLILLRVFGALAPTVLVFSSVPFAGVGGVLALYFRGIHFSVSAGVGFIALIGIALLNSLVLISVLLK